MLDAHFGSSTTYNVIPHVTPNNIVTCVNSIFLLNKLLSSIIFYLRLIRRIYLYNTKAIVKVASHSLSPHVALRIKVEKI